LVCTARTPVTVAVVSFNTRDLLTRCLRSLQPEVEAGRAEVWVVDNRSSDGSAQAARTQAPWAGVIESEENIGFGRAVNLVARQTSSDWLVGANADVALEPGALERLLDAGRDVRVGCVAPRLVLPGGRTQHSVYPLPTIPFTLAFNAGLHVFSNRWSDRLCLEGYWNADRPRAVPWAIGAFLLLRRRAFDEVGGFDEQQWMYAEDLDLGWRLHDHGWTTRYEPRARVLHESGAATAAAFGEYRAGRFMTATYGVVRRRRGRALAALTAAVSVAGAAARVAWMTPLALLSRRWRGRAASNRMWLAAHLEGLRSLSVNRETDR
jgi:N-acetylglucosaminyl-diphospho-decaprenol L-rhamnosyltransferase